MSAPAAPVSAADHLSRLLALVPWLLAHPGVAVADAAHHFAISTDQLVADLELLFVCGTPGHAPDDLIEADWEDGHIHLGNAEAIARPLRLGMDEALALIAGLRTLLDVPGAGDRDVLTSALAKLSHAAGDAASSTALSVDLSGAEPAPHVLATAREALRTRSRLHLTYLVPSRDETTSRDVDPMRVLTVADHWYLEGWCHLAAGVRLFRLDRVLEAHPTGEDGTPPEGAVARDVDDGLFQPSAEDTVVTVRLGAPAAWIADRVPAAEVTPLPGGGARVRLRTADDRWLRRLLLSVGGDAVVEDPPELGAALAAGARAALAAYEDAPSVQAPSVQPPSSTPPGTSAPRS